MYVEFGHFLLVLALAVASVQSVVPIVGARRKDPALMRVGSTTAPIIFLLVLGSFICLGNAYVSSDFSVLNVWQNSHSQMPLLFKFSGIWGNHEGSILLWVLILALFAALVSVFGGELPNVLKADVLGVQAWVMVAFLGFILVTSNPFERINPAPFEGSDLNPVLQDIGLAIHPPLLYLGYVGFSITFSFAVAAMLAGRIDAAWARWVRPWALGAWMFLTAGIAMGSYWAYYELGWGGWWFWDPVENASFIPWLTGTALLHSALVMEKREALKVWTLLLALITFSLALLGTFLVRSGVLTSVHAFATDPTRGVFILLILVLFIGGSLALFAVRVGQLRQGGLFAPISREGALIFNNLFLATAAATVLIGTLYPLVLEALTGDKISVGAPFFNYTFGPTMVPLALAIPFGPLLAWKRGDLYAASQRLFYAFGVALVAIVIAYAYAGDGSVMAAFGVGLAAWLMAGAVAELWLRAGFANSGFAVGFLRLFRLPRPIWASAIAHFGVGVTVLGIVTVTAFEQEHIVEMKPTQSTTTAGFQLTYEAVNSRRAGNFVEDEARFSVSGEGIKPVIMTPTKRLYTSRQMPTTESAIHTFWFSQLYISLGDMQSDGTVIVRIWWKPLVTLIWLGGLFMVGAAALSLSYRRLRVGAPRARLPLASGDEANAK